MTAGLSSFLKTLERQKMSVDSIKRPLMMAALNGLYVARVPVPENHREDGAKAADERVRQHHHYAQQGRGGGQCQKVPEIPGIWFSTYYTRSIVLFLVFY